MGAGGGVIALSSLSPGGLCVKVSGLRTARGSHGCTNTQVTAQGWAGRLGAVLHFRSRARWGPPLKLEPGKEAGGHHIPSLLWMGR